MARIGVFACECGTNISEKVNTVRLLESVGAMEEVVVAEPYRLLCSPDGKSYLENRIKEAGLTHVVIAACSPRDHQRTFEAVCERAGANPYLLQLVNVREQCAWVTEDSEGATEKAIRMVRAAVRRVRYQAPLSRKDLAINPDVLVLGGGPAGMQASLSLSGQGRRVYLVERGPVLGGMGRHIQSTFPDMEDVPGMLESMTERITSDGNVTLLLSHRLDRLVGFFGNFEASLSSFAGGPSKSVKVGAVVVATGAKAFDARNVRGYGAGEMDGVLTASECQDLMQAGELRLADGRSPRSVAVVHCVAREVKGYCSQVCCAYGLRISNQIKEIMPEAAITHLYSELCIPGKRLQGFYEKTVAKGVQMVRGANVRVRRGATGPTVDFVDQGGDQRSLDVDMVLLLSALEPQDDGERLAEELGVGLDRQGFFARQHSLLGPASSDREGVFIAGCASGPKGISESLVQAQAAAGKVLASLVPGRRIEIESKTSHIDETLCQGCKTCISVCPFSAIGFDPRRKIAVVNEAICRGCGNCAAACPSGAAVVKHFTYDQIYQEIAEALR